MDQIRAASDLSAAELQDMREVLASLTEGNWVEIVTGDMLTLTAEGIMIAGKWNERTQMDEQDAGPFSMEEAFAAITGNKSI